MLKLVDRIILRFIDINRKRSSRFSDIDPFVQRLRLNIFDVLIRVRIPYGLNSIRGFNLIGRIAILHIESSGSSPDFSIFIHNRDFGLTVKHVPFKYSNSGSNPEGPNSLRSSIGWAELWRCLGYKFESYLGHKK